MSQVHTELTVTFSPMWQKQLILYMFELPSQLFESTDSFLEIVFTISDANLWIMTCLTLKVFCDILLLHVKTALQIEQGFGIMVSTLTVSADIALSEILVSDQIKCTAISCYKDDLPEFENSVQKNHNIYHNV